MADDKNSELDDLAFDIFAKRVAANPLRAGEQDAIDSYRKAELFLGVRKKVRTGELKAAPADAPVLADCCAPNLKRTHPHNLVSQRMGDLAKVSRIKKWLDANPTPEREPEDLLARLNREFTDLGWDLPAVNVARQIFPAYCKS